MSNIDEHLNSMSPEKRSYALEMLPTHLAEAGQVRHLHRVLTNFQFLEAKAKTGNTLQEGPNQGTLTVYTGVYDLQEDFNRALAKMPTLSAEGTTLKALQTALRKEMNMISEYPDLLWQQLFSQLKWESHAIQEVLLTELARRVVPGVAPWLHYLLPPRQSPGFLREFYHHIQARHQLWAGRISCCAFSPDGALLAIMGTGLIQIYSVQSGQLAAQLSTSGDFCTFSADGDSFITIGADVEESGTAYGAVQLWETTSWTLQTRFLTPLPEGEYIRAGAFSPLSQFALIAIDTNITVWNISRGDNLGTFSAQVGIIRDCAFDHHGHYLVVGGELALAVWDTATWTFLYRIPTDGGWNAVSTCAISQDGQWTLASYIDSSMKLLRTATGDVIWALTDVHPRSGMQHGVLDSKFSRDGTLIASGGADHLVKLWDRATGQLKGIYAGHEMNIQSCAFSPDGAYLASGGDDSKTIIWDLAVRTTENALVRWHNQTIHGCAFGPDGTFFVTASDDETAKIWQWHLEDESLHGDTLSKHSKKVRACAVHPDGNIIVTGADDASLRIWKLENTTGSFVTRLRHSFDMLGYNMAGGYPIYECAISPDGAWAVAALHNKVEQWDLMRLQWVRDFTRPEHTIHTCAISPDGTWVVAGDDDAKLTIWDSQTGELLHLLSTDGREIARCAVSPDGTSIASVESDFEHLSKHTLHYGITTERKIIVWVFDAQNDAWQPQHCLSWNTRYISACVFSPDGRYIIAADDSGVIKVWDSNNGAEVCHYRTNQLLFCLTPHPYMPIVLGGGEGGAMVLARLVGLIYGPIITTPYWHNNRIEVECPRCRHLTQFPSILLGKATPCQHCDLLLHPNTFVLKRKSPAWFNYSSSIPPYNPQLETIDKLHRQWRQFWGKKDV